MAKKLKSGVSLSGTTKSKRIGSGVSLSGSSPAPETYEEYFKRTERKTLEEKLKPLAKETVSTIKDGVISTWKALNKPKKTETSVVEKPKQTESLYQQALKKYDDPFLYSGLDPAQKERLATRDALRSFPTQEEAKQILEEATDSSLLDNVGNALKKAPGTIASGFSAIGKGILRGAEGASDFLLTGLSSKYNPFMHLIGDFESNQAIANEIIKEDATAATLDLLGWNDVLSGGKTVQQVLDENSYIKSDGITAKVLENVGQMLPSLMVGGAYGEAAGLIAMAPSSFGSGVESALRNGATREEAVNYGILNTAIEVGTEKLFGGIGGVIGKGEIDDFVIDGLKSKIKSTLGKKVTSLVGKSLFEGGEGVIGDLFQPIAQKLTYASKEDILKLYADQNYLEDFVLGSISSGVMQVGTSFAQNKTQQETPDMEQNITTEQPTQEISQQDVQEQDVQEQETPVEEEFDDIFEQPTQQEEVTPVQQEVTPVQQKVETQKTKLPIKKQETTQKVTTDKTETTQLPKNKETKLTDEQQYAVNNWKGFDAYIINESLRSDTPLNEKQKTTVKHLKEVLDKADKHVGTVQRSIDLTGEKAKKFIDERKVGEVITEKQLVSASKDGVVYDDTKPIQLIIESKNAKDVSALMRNNEAEVIWDTGNRFKTTKVEEKDGITYIYQTDLGPTTTSQIAEPTTDAITKIEQKNKADFAKNLSKALGKPVQQNIVKPKTKEELSTWKTMLESQVERFKTDISKMKGDSSKAKDAIDIKLRAYDNYIKAGGEPIADFEDLKGTKNTMEIVADSKPKVKVSTKVEPIKVENIVTPETTIVLDEDLDVAVQDYEIACEMEDTLTVADEIELSPDSTINTEYRQTSKELEKDYMDKETKKELKALYKSNRAEVVGRIKNMFQSTQNVIRKLDKMNKTTAGLDAWLQRKTANTQGQYIVRKAQIDLDGKVVGKSVANIWKPVAKLDSDSRGVINTYIAMQSDLARKKAEANYSIEYANNIFPSQTIETLEKSISDLQTTYPNLTELAETIVKDMRTFYRNENKQNIQSGRLSKYINVSQEYASEVLKMSKEDIKNNKNNDGTVTVSNLDYLSSLNPYYFHIVRDIPDKKYSPLTTKQGTIGVKGIKGLKADANVYAIENLPDAMAKGAIENRLAMRQNMLEQVLANELGDVTEQKVTPALDKEGNFKYVINDDGNYSMQFYKLDSKGFAKLHAIPIPKSLYDEINPKNSTATMANEMKAAKALKGYAKVRRSLQTSVNLGFQVANVFRDQGDLMLNSNFPLHETIRYEGRYFIDRATGNSYFKEYKSMKGDVFKGFDYDKGLALKQSKFSKAMTMIDKLGSDLEQMTRYMEYRAARARGYSPQEAFTMSEQVTTDFDNTGSVFKISDSFGITDYMGVAMAGFNKFGQTLIGNQVDAIKTIIQNKTINTKKMSDFDANTVKRSMRTLMRLALLGATDKLLIDYFFDDDDEEFMEKIPQYVRDQNFIIRLNDEEYIKVPKGRLMAASQAIGNLIADTQYSDTDKKGILYTANLVLDNVGPNSISDANVLSSLIDIYENKDYYGNEIYDPNASGDEKLKAGVGYWFKQHGGIITNIAKYMQGATEDVPVLSKVYGRTDTMSAYNSRYWAIQNAYTNSTDPTQKLKAQWTYYEYYTKSDSIYSEKKLLDTYKEQEAQGKISKSVVKEQEQKVKSMYDEMLKGVDSPITDLSGDMKEIEYNGYVYVLNEETGKYKKMRS